MKDEPGANNISDARKKAEELLSRAPQDLSAMDIADLRGLLLELHEQNEELLDTQRRLEASRDRYNDLFDNAPVGYIVLDSSGRVAEANLKSAEMFGAERWELVGRQLAEFVERESQDAFYQHRRAALASGRLQVTEINLVRSGGEAFPAMLESVAVKDTDGQDSQLRVAVSDLTVRKTAEDASLELTEKLQLIAEEATVGVYIIQGSRFDYVNRKLAELLGYTREEMLDREDAFEMLHPEDRELMADYSRRLLSGEHASAQTEFRAMRKDGSVVYFEVFGYGTTFRGIPAIAGIAVDIAARKAAEAARESALAKAEEGRRMLAALMAYAPVGIAIADAPDTKISMVSKRLLEMTDKEEKDALGVTGEEMPRRFSIYQLDGLRMAKPEELALNRATRNGEMIIHERRLLRRPDGTEIPVLVNAGPIRDKNGKITGGVIAFTDITSMAKVERDRANFYAMVSHDIRSPLSAITGNAEFLLTFRKNKLDDDTRKMLTAMLKSCEKIRGLVDDFLVHSRLEAGGAVLSMKRVNPAQILTDVHAEFSAQAKKRGVTLSAEAADDLPKAYLDRKHVVRALSNLVQNAIDLTPKGGQVNMKAEQVDNDGAESLVFTVSDTGSGIPAAEQALVFEKYYRFQGVRGVKGTGLGLAIARAVAEAHAGWVELTSEPGKGSTFRLVLPVIKEKK